MNTLAGIQYKIESLIGIPNVEVISKAKFMFLNKLPRFCDIFATKRMVIIVTLQLLSN